MNFEFMSSKQVEENYGIKASVLDELAKRGVGPAYKTIDGFRFYSGEEIESWIAERLQED